MPAGAPTSVTIETNLSGSTWTNITTSMRSWSVSQLVGGELTLTLDNSDGRFNPENATSTLFPNFVEGKNIRVTVVKGPTTSVRFFGPITAILPDYPADPSESIVTVTALDVIGVASRTKAKPMPLAAIARICSSSASYYPLDDKSARLGFADVLGKMSDLTGRTVSAGGKIEAAGDSSFSTDTEPCVTLTAGRSIRHARGAFDSSGGALFAFYFKASTSGVIFKWNGPSGTLYQLRYDVTTELLEGEFADGTGPGLTVVAGADEWHSVVTSFDGSTLQVYVDDDLVVGDIGDALSGDPVGVEIGGDCTVSVRDLYIDPTPEGEALFLTVSDLYAKAVGLKASTLAEQTTYWGYLLNVTPSWSSSVAGVPSTGILTGGRSALESLLSLARSQSGIVYCSYTSTGSTINLVANPQSRPTSVALTIDVEQDADGGPTFERGLGDRVAEVSVFSASGKSIARDASAASALDATTADAETALATSLLRRAVAQDILAGSQNGKQRITAITLDLTGAVTDRYAAFLALIKGSRVRVSGLPTTYFGVTYLDSYVDGWTEGGTSDQDYGAVLALSPADAPPEWVWEDSTYGRWGWGDGICTLSSGITSSATSITLTWTGSATLSTSAGDYPLDIDLNGERITLPSAPAGGTSPRTFTGVTRGVAPTVARAHSAGETVEIWNAARWAM